MSKLHATHYFVVWFFRCFAHGFVLEHAQFSKYATGYKTYENECFISSPDRIVGFPMFSVVWRNIYEKNETTAKEKNKTMVHGQRCSQDSGQKWTAERGIIFTTS